MIYFNFNGLQSDKLVIIPVSYTETPTAEDPQILDVEIVIEGQALFATSGENADALEELEAFCAIESGSFAVLFKNDDGNVIPSTIRISQSECTEPPTVVDFATDGDEFSFRVIAKRQLPQRLNDSFVVARDLAFTVTGSGGTGTIFEKLQNQWAAFSVQVAGTVSLNGWHANAIEYSFFGTFQPVSPYMTLISTTIDGGIVTRLLATDVTVEKPIVRVTAIPLDETNCAYARTDTIGIDEVVTGVLPIIGFDVSPADPVTYIGLLHTTAVGIESSATVDTATMTLSFSSFVVGRTIRVYGIEEAASVTSSLTDYISLATGYTLTTAFVEITFDSSGISSIDLAAVLQELIDDTAGWSEASPLQLWISDITGMPVSGLDETAVMVSGSALNLLSS